MRTQHEVHHQGYNTIRTVQNTKNEGILNVSWEGGETQVAAKGLGIRMASGISTTLMGGIISHPQFYIQLHLGKGRIRIF